MNRKTRNRVVYGWYADGQIFYVGIGTIRRSNSIKGRNKRCLGKRNIAEKNNCFEIRILQQGLTFDEACDKEIELIQQYGRLDLGTGCLTNMTVGGEGNSNPSKETRKKISDANKGKTLPAWTDERKEKLKKAWERGDFDHRKGSTHDPETIKIMKEKKKRGKHPRAKPVQTPLGIFDCQQDAAEAHGISKMKISRRIKSNQFSDYKLLNKEN